MSRRYYSSRNNLKSLSLEDLYWNLKHLYFFFRKKDYFKRKADITEHDFPDELNHKAVLTLRFQPFPIDKWEQEDITEPHIFDMLEFLYDYASEPSDWTSMTDETGYNYCDYECYDDDVGQKEFRDHANMFLCDYRDGYELTSKGEILSIGGDGLKYILNAEIIPYDEVNVDSKVRNAIHKWRNRNIDMVERKEAIRELADVFEWLKSNKLSKVLNTKDEADLFNIANNFHIRHHNTEQKRQYDENIWFSWIFHFYLATYHATIRLLKKSEENAEKD